MRVLDLFAGIGGFTLGLERAGFKTVAFCEIDPYAQKVLAKNWPEVPIYDDVRQLTAERLASDGIGVDVITGGFPCQDISTAGRQAGIEGERSGLWSEIARLISELQPRYAIMENVTNLISGDRGRWFGRVLGDLAEIGYDAEWHCIPASHVGAHHRRDRIWIVAYPNGNSESGMSQYAREVRETSFLAYPNELGTSDIWKGEAIHNQQRHCKAAESKRHEQQHGIERNSYVAYPSGTRRQGRKKTRSYGEERQESEHQLASRLRGVQRRAWEVEPNVGRVANGVPARSHRLKCLGNAVVPQIPELIGRAIMEAE